jgi:hypothetical protein
LRKFSEAEMKKNAVISFLIAVALVMAMDAGPGLAQDNLDSQAVRRLLMQTFDKPEAPLGIDAVVVEQDIAIADWSQGELGGRALLRRKDGVWSITLCAGDALKQSASLEKLGLRKPLADMLAAELSQAERGLAPALLDKFARFDAIVVVDATGRHSPLDPYHRPIQ